MNNRPVVFEIEGRSPVCGTSLRQKLRIMLATRITRNPYIEIIEGIIEPVRFWTTSSRNMMEDDDV